MKPRIIQKNGLFICRLGLMREGYGMTMRDSVAHFCLLNDMNYNYTHKQFYFNRL